MMCAFPSPIPMTVSYYQQAAKCSETEACEIQEVIEQVLPLSKVGRTVLTKPLAYQIMIAKRVIAA